MRVIGFDERHVVSEGVGANFVVFIYEGGGEGCSWSVDSLLLSGSDLPHVLDWLRANLPVDSCWSLGVVLAPEQPTADSDLSIRWIVGDDLLNSDLNDLSPTQQRVAEQMLARRHRVGLLPGSEAD